MGSVADLLAEVPNRLTVAMLHPGDRVLFRGRVRTVASSQVLRSRLRPGQVAVRFEPDDDGPRTALYEAGAVVKVAPRQPTRPAVTR